MREIVTDELTGVVTLRDGEGNERIVKKGESVQEAEAAFFPPYVPPVPQSVSPANFCIALDQLGLLDEVEAYVATLPRAAQIKWQRATSIDRDNPLIAAAAEIKKWSVEQVDEVFRLAASM